jgi:hypothetical protein
VVFSDGAYYGRIALHEIPKRAHHEDTEFISIFCDIDCFDICLLPDQGEADGFY